MDAKHRIGSLSPEATRAFRVRKTLLKLLSKRNYIVPDEELNITPDQFLQRYGDNPNRDSLKLLVQKQDDPTAVMFVFLPEDEKVGVKPIKTYCLAMKEQNAHAAILVVRNSITPLAKSALKEMASRGFSMEYFKESELLVDITEHNLVPQHIPLSTQEAKELLTRYRLKPSQLPRIQVTDPVARYLGLAKGQIVKIIRKSETAGRYVTYRVCI